MPTWYHVATNGPIVCLLAACCFYLNTKSCPRQFKLVIPERVATTTYRIASHTWKTNVTKGICMKTSHPLCTKHSVIIPHQCVRGEYIFICWVPAPVAWSSISSLAVSWSYLQQNNSLWISFQQQLWKGTTRYDSKGYVARLGKATKAKFEESTGNLCRKALPSSQGVTTAFMDVRRWFWVEIPEQVR